MENYVLSFRKFRMNLFIGCDPRERAFRQPIDINMRFILSKLPKGCHTDQLDDVICYRDIIEMIQKEYNDKEFNLIEHLAYEIGTLAYKQAEKKTSDPFSLEITVTKIHPPVENVLEGVSFTCTIPA